MDVHWLLYNQPGYKGRGLLRSAEVWRNRGSYRLCIYEKPDFSGHMMEFMDDCPCVSDRFHHRHVYSCNVMNGYWIFYEYPNYRGRQYFLRPGEYRRYRDWCATCAVLGSFRRVTEY
uniref:gamma-crystallin M2-like n=1 Tax=Monopterus albus TaxID=43700 RepID=UPI0009B3D127|nr:gamma-crystallin M2-like [Monopterus albus]